MAEYTQWASPKYCDGIFGFTDASWYTKKAKTIEFTHGNRMEGDYPYCDYKLRLQRRNSTGGWTTVFTHTGYFKRYVTVSFDISLVPAGYYRIRGDYQYRGHSTKCVNATPPFYVER